MDHEAVIYVRVSTEEQARGGVSLDAQRARCEALCAMRGLRGAEVIVDAGVSAGKPLSEREGGQRVLALVQTHRLPVVAYKLDRLFRDAVDCLNVTRAWDRLGVALHLVDLGGQALDTSSAMGRFFLTMMAGVAELERNLISERTKTAMAHAKQQGRRVGAVPYGYRLEGDQLVTCPDEQAVLTCARELREAGLSLRAVARELSSRGFAPRSGARWHAQQISRMVA